MLQFLENFVPKTHYQGFAPGTPWVPTGGFPFSDLLGYSLLSKMKIPDVATDQHWIQKDEHKNLQMMTIDDFSVTLTYSSTSVKYLLFICRKTHPFTLVCTAHTSLHTENERSTQACRD